MSATLHLASYKKFQYETFWYPRLETRPDSTKHNNTHMYYFEGIAPRCHLLGRIAPDTNRLFNHSLSEAR